MPWTDSARKQYRRWPKRYATDLTDAEFALVAPHLPPASRLGRPRATDLREVVNAILYLLRSGCQWALLPKGFPPKSTVYDYFRRWWDDGTWRELYHALLAAARLAIGRDPTPTAAIVDSQSARTTEAGGPRGYDAGKKVKGRKRHILTDTLGLLLTAVVHPADVQDRDGLALVLPRIRRSFPWLELVFADGGYDSEVAARTAHQARVTLAVVKRPANTKGFVILPRHWVVERTFAWLGRSRRLAKDFEARIATATALVYLAATQLLVRRLART